MAGKTTLSSIHAYWMSMTGQARWHSICKRTKHAMRAAGIDSIVLAPEKKKNAQTLANGR